MFTFLTRVFILVTSLFTQQTTKMDNHGFNHNNPFLEDLIQLNDASSNAGSSDSYYTTASSSSYQLPAPVAAPAPAPAVPAAPYRNIVLPSFYVDRPASWFAMVEGRFRLHGVLDEQNRFDLLVNALPKESSSLVVDVIENPPSTYQYSILKQRLLAAHQLTDFQKIAKLHKMEPLGGRRPSELLAAMFEFCPRGHEANIFFTHLFLERLPAELRILLGEDDHEDPRQLAAKADKLWSLHGGKFAAVASVEALDSAPVAAVAARGRTGRDKVKGGAGRQRAVADADGARQAAVKPATNPRDLAQLESGLCYYHFTYGDKATKCKDTCSWGN